MSYVDVQGLGHLGAGAFSQAMASMTPDQRAANLIAVANNAMAVKMRALQPLVQRLPVSAWFKSEVMVRPASALLRLFYPMESLGADILSEANAWSGKSTRLVGTVVVPMAADQPNDAALGARRGFVRRARIMVGLMVLSQLDPLALAVGTAKALFKRGAWSLERLNEFMRRVPTPQQAAQEAVNAAKRAKEAAEKAAAAARTNTAAAAAAVQAAAQKAADEARRYLPPAPRLAGLGYVGLGEDDALMGSEPPAPDAPIPDGPPPDGAGLQPNETGAGNGAEVGAVVGAALTPEMVQMLLSLVSIFTAGAVTAVTGRAGPGTGPGGPGGPGPGGPGPGGPGPGGPGTGPGTGGTEGIPIPLLLLGAAGLVFMLGGRK